MASRVHHQAVSSFARQLRDVPKEFRRELRPKIRKASGKVAGRVKANSAWSERIPGAVKTKVSFSSRSGGVQVFVDSSAAPHARPLEFGSQGRSNVNRHPVFGKDVWVDQPARPFFLKAVQDSEQDVVREVQDAIDNVLRRI